MIKNLYYNINKIKIFKKNLKMAINKVVQDAINEQILAEMYSANIYLSMAAYFESKNLKGFANWMNVQWKEETAHAVKFINYLYERGGRVVIKTIESPPVEFGTPLEAFKSVLEHEKYVTGRIHKLYELALGERDYATQILLQWYVTEQVEEEANATEIIEKIKMLGESGHHLLMLDKELGERKFKG